MKTEDIASICHEANRQYCETIGDHSQVPWALAPSWQKDSAINGVLYHLDNPGAGPSAGHRSWLAQKKTEGWVYGPEKDEDKKEHPCMVPFDELPPEQQAKDRLFENIVRALAPNVSRETLT